MLKNVGKALAMIRQQRGVSQYQLAATCKMGRSQISKYESGREMMKLDTLDRLLTALDFDAEQFFGFMRSLDEFLPTQRESRGGRGDEPLLDEAFENLHLAIDKLQRAVELSLRRAAAQAPTPEAGPIPGEVPASPLRRIQGYEERVRGQGRE